MKKLLSLGLAVALGLFSVAGNAFSQTARDVAKKAFPSTVLILMEDNKGQLASLGSGFLVEENVIASNFHVIEGASRGLIKLIGENTKHEIQGILASDETNDLVLLKVTGLKSPTLSLGDSDTIVIGDELYAVGNPRGLEGTFSQGIVSSIRKFDRGSLLQITAPISPGSSGGPILDSSGKVIGVAVATFKDGQNLNFAIPSNALKALLKSKGAVKPLVGLGKKPSEKSILKDLGSRNTSGVVGRKFEWTSYTDCKFSVLNQLREPIQNAEFMVIFYDDEGSPIEFKLVSLPKLIPAGLATWTEEISVNTSTARFTSDSYRSLFKGDYLAKLPKEGRVEIRVLGFDLVN